MDRDFWLTRWQNRQIGFHLGEVNPHLLAHQDLLPPVAASEQSADARAQSTLRPRIFVPLCGKTLDLAWLRARGYDVVGVELSELAVREFFSEQGLAPSISQDGELLVFRTAGMTLFCGDFFALTRAQLGPVAGFYDRAALIALPATLRTRYAAHMLELLPEHVVGLMVCFDYPQAQMNGPPFGVSEAEVRALYEPQLKVELIASHDILANEARFQQAGLTSLHERVYRLER